MMIEVAKSVKIDVAGAELERLKAVAQWAIRHHRYAKTADCWVDEWPSREAAEIREMAERIADL